MQRLSHAVRVDRRIEDRGTQWCRPTGLSAGGRSLLPLRHVLHDQVSVCAASSLECGFSPLDAARQGRQVSRRGTRWRDKVLSSTDLVGTLAGIPVIAEAVNAGIRSTIGRKVLDAALGVHPQAPVPSYQSNTAAQTARASVAARRDSAAVARRGSHARQGGAICHLLCESQRAADWTRSCAGIRAQRHRGRAGRTGKLLRNAQIRVGRYAGGCRLEGQECPAALRQ